jgi:hypothetical protein
MTETERFFWGFCGSLAVEIVNLFQAYHSQRIHIPQRYKRKGFWVVRALVCVIAGGLAVAYKIESELLAANIGASAPLIMQALARGYSDPSLPSSPPPELPPAQDPTQKLP